MTDEAPLTPNDANLAQIASRDALDGFLNDLVERAVVLRAGLGVGLLVNGMIVMGILAPPDDFAAGIDAEWLRLFDSLDRPDDSTEQEWAEAREKVATRTQKRVESYRELLDQLEIDSQAHNDGEGLDVEAIPGDLARRAIGANSFSHLTLRDVRITAPAQVGVTHLDAMRVAVRQIAGWWILETDGHGKNSTVLWEPVDAAPQ
jgi:hypothetical protein